MGRIRTFIGVDVGKPIRDRLIALQETLGGTGVDVKWVERANLHITILFLGEVDERELPKMCRVVADTAKQHARFTISVEGAGCFPNPRRPRILWAGVSAGAEALVALHDALESALAELGYRREERRYTPHITLGRVRNEGPVDDLAKALARRTEWKAGETPIHELRVMSSELTSRGPAYTVLSRAPLALTEERSSKSEG